MHRPHPPFRSIPATGPGGPAAGVLRALRHLWLALLLLPLLVPAVAAPLQVDGRSALPLWPHARLLLDPARTMDVHAAIAARERFERPRGTPGNLGRSNAAVWLLVPVGVPGADPVHRVLQLDYPSLNRADVYLLKDGRLVMHGQSGNALRASERALDSRSLAVPLSLPPGESELLVRVVSTSSLVLPITLRSNEDFALHESKSHLLLGLMFGLGGCMLLYSLTHWVSLRDSVFLDYAAMMAGNLVFFANYFGVGPQVLWGEQPLVSRWIGPMAVLVSVAGGMNFMRKMLRAEGVSPFCARLLKFISVCALGMLAFAFTGFLPYAVLQVGATGLGLCGICAALPVAFLRARSGERIATLMLFGWVFYMLGAISVALLLNGMLAPSAGVLSLYPLSTMIEMSAWMAVLSLRVQAIHRNADRARLESEALRTLAHTDALTGLPNRRGLQERLAQALSSCSPQQVLAVYLLDLDGFKPVNDRHGHDVGDALLVAVGSRLQQQLRSSDVVARMGGDEFVVLATGLADAAAAQALGHKLLAAFELPFDAAGQRCEVGLTAGYALAPLDGVEADELLKRADAAMYAGKQAGRRRVQRDPCPQPRMSASAAC